LFRNRLLLVITLFSSGQANIDRTRFAGDDLDRIDTLLGQVDLTRVGVVDLDGRDLAQDLDRERRGRSDAQPGDDGSEQDRGLGAVDCGGWRETISKTPKLDTEIRLTGTDRIDLALDLNDAVLAPKQVDRVIDLGILDDDVFGVFVVFL